MKKKTVEKLNKFLDINSDLIPVSKNGKVEISPTVDTSTVDLTADYNYSRDQYHNLIESGNDALKELLEIAKESESPRAFEVTAQLMRTISDTTKELLQLQKTKKEVARENKDPHTVNNSLFIGSTKELQELLNKKNADS